MPTGTNDFNQNLSTNPTAPLIDSGENANHLLMGGGGQSRSGRWIFATGFEEGATPFLVSNASGTGGVAAVASDQTYQGLKSFQLKAGNAVNNWSYFQKLFFYPASSYGIEFLFLRSYALDSEFEFLISAGAKGENKDKFRVGKIVVVITTGPATTKIYLDKNGTRTLVKDVSNYISGSAYQWHYIKFVFDVKENIVKYLIFDDETFNINVAGYEFTSTTVQSSIELRLTNNFAGVNPDFRIDNFIITADEP